MLAKDLMVSINHVKHLTPEMTLKEANDVLDGNERLIQGKPLSLKGTVVLDEKGRLIGIVSMKDIMRAMIPKYFSQSIAGFSWEGQLDEQIAKVKERTLVIDIMISDVIVANEKDTLLECIDLMIENNLQRLPVVNDEKQVVGMLYMRALYGYISQKIKNDGGER